MRIRERHIFSSELPPFGTSSKNRKSLFPVLGPSPPPFLVGAFFCFGTMASSPKGVDVVGVDSGTHGRSCENHDVCGHFVVKDDLLYCNWAVQKIASDVPEACVQVFKLAPDGHVGCHVGYLPRRVVKSSRCKDDSKKKDQGRSFNGTWLKVVSDLRLSDNSAERSRSHRNFGIVYCHEVTEEDYLKGKNPFEDCIQLPENVAGSFELPAAEEASSNCSSPCAAADKEA
jgi:hypothetical protein